MRPADTSEEAHQVQLAIWRRMGDRGTAELAIRMSAQARIGDRLSQFAR